jgi:polyphosphate kinase
LATALASSELPAWRAPDDDDTHDTLLEFNAHVLALAQHPRTPLCERARFLAILGGNLDEFFTVHVGEAKAWLAGKGAFEPDFTDTDGGIGARGSDIQSLIHDTMLAAKGAGSLLFRGREWFRSSCRPAFAEVGIRLLRWTELSDASRAEAERYFAEHVRPVFASPSEEFPHLPSLGLALVVVSPDDRLYVVPIPPSLPRAIALHPGEEYMAMEELVLLHATTLCPAAGPDAKAFVIRITRASDTRLGKRPNGDPVSAAEALLARREVAPVVRLEVNCSMPRAIRQRLLTSFRAEAQAVGVGGATLDACDVFETDGPVVSLDALNAVASIARDDLLYPSFRARVPIPASRPIWDRLRESDVFVHFPYDAFSASIGRLLDDAADDPTVTAVRCSIYRTDRDSRVIAALARAARAGKDVAVVVELMARFDERPNLHWSKALTDAGCRVVHAPAGLKVHGKIGAVIRREDGGLATYGFVSTGNLNTGTSAHYTDFALLTARPEVVAEILAVFDQLAEGHVVGGFTHLLVSPTTMRGPLISLIGREASRGAAGLIRAKLNGLDDQEIIGALYTASQAGARVDLLVRGLCTLRPGIPGRSERITVSSIVGRFLEHGRIYAFGGGDGAPCDYWIGSADWRMRNLTHRVEVAAPIVDAEARDRVEEVLHAELNDPTRWIMRSDGSYSQDPAAASAEGTQDRFVARLGR